MAILKAIINFLFHAEQPTNSRYDGYSEYNAQLVIALQAKIECSGDCDYDALRLTLLYARSINEYKLTPIGLKGFYTDKSIGYLFQ